MVITINAKAGEGKTLIAVHLAKFLKASGFSNVVMHDIDIAPSDVGDVQSDKGLRDVAARFTSGNQSMHIVTQQRHIDLQDSNIMGTQVTAGFKI